MLDQLYKWVKEFDDFGLLAHKDSNLGNANNWYFSFRVGLMGLQSRMVSLEEHRQMVYEWHTTVPFDMHERNIAIILFSMDSAIECTVFAANALGQAREKKCFRDVSDHAALRRISPRDILGSPNMKPLVGYQKYYPKLQSHFLKYSSLIQVIQDNHDVSKHRHQNYWGGTTRSDPPPGFFERFGIPTDHALRNVIAPMAEVLIPLEPKLPIESIQNDSGSWTQLESLIDEFSTFSCEATYLACCDAKKTIFPPFG